MIVPGQRFGRLTALRRIPRRWVCRCDCGECAALSAASLKRARQCPVCTARDTLHAKVANLLTPEEQQMLFSLSISPAGSYLFTPQGGGGSPPPAGWPQSPSGAYASAGFDPKNGLYGSWDGTTFTALTAAAMISNPSLIQAGVGYVIGDTDAAPVITMPEALQQNRTYVASMTGVAQLFTVNNADDSQEWVSFFLSDAPGPAPTTRHGVATGYDSGSGSWQIGSPSTTPVGDDPSPAKAAINVSTTAQALSVNGGAVDTAGSAEFAPTGISEVLIGGYTAGAVRGVPMTLEYLYVFPHQADANLPTLSTP